MKAKRYYTITEAARKLKITRSSVHEAIRKGRLEASRGKIVQVTEGWRISPTSLKHYRVSALHQWVGKKTF